MNDLMSGISVAIVPKFSLSNFWPDVIASKSTIVTYGKPVLNTTLTWSTSLTPRQSAKLSGFSCQPLLRLGTRSTLSGSLQETACLQSYGPSFKNASTYRKLENSTPVLKEPWP